MRSTKRESLWKGIIKPLFRDHSNWYYRGRIGDGRIVMSDENLQGTNLRGLPGARLERVDLSGAVMNILDDVELYSCRLDDALIQNSTWKRAVINDTSFTGATMFYSNFEDARIEGGDWLGAWIERSTWTNASISNAAFDAATLVDSRFDGAKFVDCSFFRADLSRRDVGLDLARCPQTAFVRCDFRNANIDGLRLNNAMFMNCRFADVRGKPDLEGSCTMIAPDFSIDESSESASGVAGVRDGDELLRLWRDRDESYLRHWYRFGSDTGYQPEKNYPERKT